MAKYICLTCNHIFEAKYPIECPKCGDSDIILKKYYDECCMINDRDDYFEDRRLGL